MLKMKGEEGLRPCLRFFALWGEDRVANGNLTSRPGIESI